MLVSSHCIWQYGVMIYVYIYDIYFLGRFESTHALNYLITEERPTFAEHTSIQYIVLIFMTFAFALSAFLQGIHSILRQPIRHKIHLCLPVEVVRQKRRKSLNISSKNLLQYWALEVSHARFQLLLITPK